MSETTNIAWTTSTWNPWVGCQAVSPGCAHCYAEAWAKRWGRNFATRTRTSAQAWRQPLAWNRKAAALGARWAVFPSLCDPFDNEVPHIWRHDFWKLILNTPNLTWLLLTKRIGNVVKMWPDGPPQNAWLGASVVNQEEADRDLNKLLETPAAKRFVSYEPGLGPVHLTPWLKKIGVVEPDPYGRDKALDWVIVGGESSQGGAKARPFDLAWARSTVAQCKAAGVPVFVKQLGSCALWDGVHDAPIALERNDLRIAFKDRAGADPAEWPLDLRVQEFPA